MMTTFNDCANSLWTVAPGRSGSGCAPARWTLAGIAAGCGHNRPCSHTGDVDPVQHRGRCRASGRIAPQLGNEVQVALPGHSQGVVVAKVPIEYQMGQGDNPRISCSKASSMALMRPSSGVNVTATFLWFVLPFGRPGRRLSRGDFALLASAFALLTAFSASLRTTCRCAAEKSAVSAHSRVTR